MGDSKSSSGSPCNAYRPSYLPSAPMTTTTLLLQSKVHATPYNWKPDQVQSHTAWIEQHGELMVCRATGVGGILHNVANYYSPLDNYNFGTFNS